MNRLRIRIAALVAAVALAALAFAPAAFASPQLLCAYPISSSGQTSITIGPSGTGCTGSIFGGGYHSLRIEWQAAQDSTLQVLSDLELTFNNDTGSHYGWSIWQDWTPSPGAGETYAATTNYCKIGALPGRVAAQDTATMDSAGEFSVPMGFQASLIQQGVGHFGVYGSNGSGTFLWNQMNHCVWYGNTSPATITNVTLTTQYGTFVVGSNFDFYIE